MEYLNFRTDCFYKHKNFRESYIKFIIPPNRENDVVRAHIMWYNIHYDYLIMSDFIMFNVSEVEHYSEYTPKK